MNRVTKINRFHALLVASLFGVLHSSLAALPASADSFEPPRVTVKFGDLDISRQPGAAVLYARIRAAAQKVCAPVEDRSLAARMRLDACIKNAISDAVTTVDEPALLAVYRSESGRTVSARIA